MKIYNYKDLSSSELNALCTRNRVDDAAVNDSVISIIAAVQERGDAALLEMAVKFDKVSLSKLFLEKKEIQELAYSITKKEKQAIDTAYKNIYKFHKAQLFKEKKITTSKGVTCWRETRAIEKVGLYVPGGTAVLPSTFLMLAIPARIAGCKQVVVCTPPQQKGTINQYVAYCAKLLKIDRIYLVGGAQAVAAMAYGTESIPKVDKIFGPGNRYVTNAKSILQSRGQAAIDMPAGPSEVLVIADKSCNPSFVAADLLSQAEHGADSQTVLVATDKNIIDKVMNEVGAQIKNLERCAIAEKALGNSFAVSASLSDAISFSNSYAPEHLIIASSQYKKLIPKIVNAGSVFLGNYTPEAAGDYASGTNHTLPTSGFAKSYSGVSVDSFVKKITFQEISKQGINNLGNTIETLAALEGLQAHAEAIKIRRQAKK